MHISAICPRCDSCYQVNPELRGQNMRCPNPLCRAVFEVRADGDNGTPPVAAAPPPTREPTPLAQQRSGTVGDIVPILQAEAMPVAAPVKETGNAKETPPIAAPVAVPGPAARAQPSRTEPGISESSPAWDKLPPPLRRPVSAPSDRPATAPIPAGPGKLETMEPLPPPVAEKVPLPRRVPSPEPTAPAVLSEPPATPSWGQLPPPVRRSEPAPAESENQSAVLVADDLSDADFFSADPENIAEPEPPAMDLNAALAPAVSSPSLLIHEARRSRRRARWIILCLLLLLGGGLGAGLFMARGSRAGNEAERFQKAEQLYDKGEYADALARFQSLNHDFPDSKERERYRFMAELSAVREAVISRAGSVDETARQALDFLQRHKGDPLLSDHEGEVWQTLYGLVNHLTEEADAKKSRPLLALAKRGLAETGKLKPPPHTNEVQRTQEARKNIQDLEVRLDALEQRRGLLAQLRDAAKRPTADGVRSARELVRASGLAADPEFRELLTNLVKDHLSSVTFTPVSEPAQDIPVPRDLEPSYLVLPLLHQAKTPPPDMHGTVYALVRGVLCALDPRTGQARWVRRVGIDTSQLPVRVPATPVAPALALVMSSDTNTLAAVSESDGRTIWERRTSGPCLGQPVLVNNRVLVPTYTGRVDEIQLSDGRLLGWYDLGQPLTVGGALQPGTAFVCFPADDYAVYVLDAARRVCAGILYSNHLRGSLRSEPVILMEPGASAAAKGILLLPQAAETQEAVKLRAFSLPISNPDQPELATDLTVPGWSWFPPYSDGERLALATDAAAFALCGVKQKGNHDPEFFRLLEHDVTLDIGRKRFGRAQIVHADAENFWVLAHRKLQRLQLTFKRREGPSILQRWPAPVDLGSPLHAAQVLHDGSGATTLFLVTQTGRGQTALVTAVDARTGRLHWQRQLGLVGHGIVRQLGKGILVENRSGILWFDADRFQDRPWQPAGELLDALANLPGRNIILTAKTDTAYLLNMAGTSLKVVRFQPGKDRTTSEYILAGKLAGTPALGHDCILLPLDNGVLERVPLDKGAAAQGPDWRDPAAEEGAPGHVVALGPEEFVASDGSRGLKLIHWPGVKGKKSLPRRIVTPPVVLHASDKKSRLCVADADDTIHLLDNDLNSVRSWRMPGKISAGPYIQGPTIGCVMGKTLVWIDPEKDEILWQYKFPTDIVGQPQRIKDMIVVANVAGQIVGLDADTGRPLGAGYTLRADVAPSMAPLPFTADRLFVPLTDGTIMLIAQKLLE